jgi:3-deoxy-D-manno-octulosonic acid (KDO) 8-phosphate synthase
MRSIHVPPDQLELSHGESNEDEILLRMARKYRRLLYQNRIPFFDKCSIDPEARSTVHKYRAEYGVHAYEKLAERCKELLEEQES